VQLHHFASCARIIPTHALLLTFTLAISCECRRKRLADQDERDRVAKLAQEEEERRRAVAEEEAERLKQEEAAAEKEAKRFGKKRVN
jgi:signal transduction histidine kinase